MDMIRALRSPAQMGYMQGLINPIDRFEMARTQSKFYPEIRENIMRTAARLFAEKSFASATIMDLAEACQSSRGALYHYFDSKEEILECILSEHVNTMLAELQKIGEERLEPLEHLRTLTRRIMQLNVENRSEQIVLLNDWNQLSSTLQTEIASSQRKIVSIIRDALTRVDGARKITPSNGSAYAMMFMGLLNYTYTWFDPEAGLSAEGYADLAVDVFLEGLAPTPGTA